MPQLDTVTFLNQIIFISVFFSIIFIIFLKNFSIHQGLSIKLKKKVLVLYTHISKTLLHIRTINTHWNAMSGMLGFMLIKGNADLFQVKHSVLTNYILELFDISYAFGESCVSVYNICFKYLSIFFVPVVLPTETLEEYEPINL